MGMMSSSKRKKAGESKRTVKRLGGVDFGNERERNIMWYHALNRWIKD